MDTQSSEKKQLISYCGICCSLCPPYKNNECPGCLDLPDCNIHQCAKTRNQRYCFECTSFPCELYEKGFDWDLNTFPSLIKYNPGIVKWKPYSSTYIRFFKLAKKIRQKEKK